MNTKQTTKGFTPKLVIDIPGWNKIGVSKVEDGVALYSEHGTIAVNEEPYWLFFQTIPNEALQEIAKLSSPT